MMKPGTKLPLAVALDDGWTWAYIVDRMVYIPIHKRGFWFEIPFNVAWDLSEAMVAEVALAADANVLNGAVGLHVLSTGTSTAWFEAVP